MMKYLVVGLVSILILAACSQEQDGSQTQISSKAIKDSTPRLLKNYFSDCKNLRLAAIQMDSTLLTQLEFDKPLANKAIKAFTDFAYYCQGDSLSPVFLIKTAQIARAINNLPQAKLVLDRCIENYPNFQNRAAALFLMAQLYDDDTYMNNEMEAKRLYEQIINDYPKSDWAQSAKGAITFIGKSDQEIANALLKRKK